MSQTMAPVVIYLSTTPSQISTLQSNQIISGQAVDNTLQLNQQGGGRIDIPLPYYEEVENTVPATIIIYNSGNINLEYSDWIQQTIAIYYQSGSVSVNFYETEQSVKLKINSVTFNLSYISTIPLAHNTHSTTVTNYRQPLFTNEMIYTLNLTGNNHLENGRYTAYIDEFIVEHEDPSDNNNFKSLDQNLTSTILNVNNDIITINSSDIDLTKFASARDTSSNIRRSYMRIIGSSITKIN